MLDRTKEPGPTANRCSSTSSPRSPRRRARHRVPRVIGGRYGLSSKEFTPGMVAGIFAELAREQPRPRFTIGITDDVGGTSLPYDADLDIEDPATVRAVFFGIGSDGTVGANKNTIKILGADAERARAGLLRLRLEEVRRAHRVPPALRAEPDPRALPRALGGLRRLPPAGTCSTVSTSWRARPTARRCCSTRRSRPRSCGTRCPGPVQQAVLDKRLRALRRRRRRRRARGRPARADEHGPADLLLRDLRRAAARTRPSTGSRPPIRATYARRGEEVVRRNEAAVDAAVGRVARGAACRPRRHAAGRDLPPAGPRRRAGVRPHRDRRR